MRYFTITGTSVRERSKEILRRASEEDDRNKDNRDRQRGNERRHSDLLRTIENGALDWFPLRKVPVDVFDLDRRVIDENADGKRQAAQGHYIQGVAKQA